MFWIIIQKACLSASVLTATHAFYLGTPSLGFIIALKSCTLQFIEADFWLTEFPLLGIQTDNLNCFCNDFATKLKYFQKALRGNWCLSKLRVTWAWGRNGVLHSAQNLITFIGWQNFWWGFSQVSGFFFWPFGVAWLAGLWSVVRSDPTVTM